MKIKNKSYPIVDVVRLLWAGGGHVVIAGTDAIAGGWYWETCWYGEEMLVPGGGLWSVKGTDVSCSLATGTTLTAVGFP